MQSPTAVSPSSIMDEIFNEVNETRKRLQEIDSLMSDLNYRVVGNTGESPVCDATADKAPEGSLEALLMTLAYINRLASQMRDKYTYLGRAILRGEEYSSWMNTNTPVKIQR